MVIFEKKIKTISDQNKPYNALNCTVLKKNFGGACPRTPYQCAWLRHAQHVGSRHANSQI